MAWNGLLLVAGGQVTVREPRSSGALLLGCVASVLVIAATGAARSAAAEQTADHRPRADHVRRPGSLGGTEVGAPRDETA